MKPSDLRVADTIRKKGTDQVYVIDHAFPEKVVAHHTVDLFEEDLEQWEKADLSMREPENAAWKKNRQ